MKQKIAYLAGCIICLRKLKIWLALSMLMTKIVCLSGKMKTRKRAVLVLSFIVLLVLSISITIVQNSQNNVSIHESESAYMSCSIFTVKDNVSVFFGNNEDEGGNRERTDMWFVPSDDGKSYSCVYVGFAENEPGGDDVDGIEIGGMNTEGLCFDGNGIVPGEEVTYRDDLGSPYYYLTCNALILRECATVSEVINWYQTHNIGGTWWDQIHWADKTGDAVVVSPALDGSIAFTRINGSFLVSTNFNVDHPSGIYYPCPRYDHITATLETITSTGNVSVENCAQILEAVHVPETYSYAGTVYSNVYDLKQQLIYLYVHGNYDNVVVLDLAEELAKGYHGYIIESLKDHSPEELFPASGLWPIQPQTSVYARSVIIILVSLPIVMFTGFGIAVYRRLNKNRNRGKQDVS